MSAANGVAPTALAHDEDLLGAGQVSCFTHRVKSLGDGEDEPRACVGELPGQFLGGEEGVGHGHRAAERRHRVKRDWKLEDVRTDRREDISFAEPSLCQTERHAANIRRKLPIGQRASARPIDQRGFVGQSFGMAQDEGRQRGLGDRDVGIRTAEDHRRSSFHVDCVPNGRACAQHRFATPGHNRASVVSETVSRLSLP